MPADHEMPKPDDFVAKVVGDSKAPPDALLLSGFVGRATEAKHTRIYLDPELREYVDIPDDAILYSKAIPHESSPLGGSFVWIKRDAELVHGSSKAARFRARFLEGRIAAAYGASAAAMQAAAAPQQPEPLYYSHPIRCIITINCMTVAGPRCPGDVFGTPAPRADFLQIGGGNYYTSPGNCNSMHRPCVIPTIGPYCTGYICHGEAQGVHYADFLQRAYGTSVNCGVHYTSLGECNKSYMPCAIPSIDVACHTPPGVTPWQGWCKAHSL